MESSVPQRPLTVYIETYGCQMNKNDSELIRGILRASGFGLTDSLETADIALVNTCSVREHAEERVLGRIAMLSGWKRRRTHRRLAVLGCMAQRLGRGLAEMRPYVDVIVGPDGYRRLPELLAEDLPRTRVHDALDAGELYSGVDPARAPDVCGWVTVSRGCDNFCAYCIVPHVRGRERSRPARDIADEAARMARDGFREVTLLGQNVNSYRDGDTDFASLLGRISAVPGLERIRFMTSHPRDCSDRLLEAMAALPRVCPHLHLPVQSGSTSVLARMNRGYTADHYRQRVLEARRRVPGLSVTTDLLVGFPGETESEFRETMDLVAELRFDEAFMYRFSPRAGTAAAALPDPVPGAERSRRLSELIGLQRKITLETRAEWIGRTAEVLAEGPSARSEGEWMGRTPQGHVVVFDAAGAAPGRTLRLRLSALNGATLKGVPAAGPGESVQPQCHLDGGCVCS
jgi:tRNA-2-methylthio-N6-dimethylallyladenosine synthase